MKRNHLVCVIILLLALITGCSSSRESDFEDYEATTEVAVETEYKDGLSNDSPTYSGLQTNRKIIQNAYVVMETLKFDEIVSSIKENTYGLNGYFENMRIDGKRKNVDDYNQERRADFRIRIPKEKYETFMSSFGELGNIIVNELNSEDVTDRYIDTEARLNALKVQESRLLEIMKSATDIEDIIALEERLSEVRYEIEKYTGDIRKWDNLVEFTTIQLEIREVNEISEPVPESLLQRSIDQFVDSVDSVNEILQYSVVFLFGILPFLVVIIPVALAARFIKGKTSIYRNAHPKLKKSKKPNQNNNKE